MNDHLSEIDLFVVVCYWLIDSERKRNEEWNERQLNE